MGTFEDIGALGKGALVLAVALAVGFLVIATTLTNIYSQEGISAANCANSSACNGTVAIQAALGTMPAWIGLVILIGIAGIVLALIRKFKS